MEVRVGMAIFSHMPPKLILPPRIRVEVLGMPASKQYAGKLGHYADMQLLAQTPGHQLSLFDRHRQNFLKPRE